MSYTYTTRKKTDRSAGTAEAAHDPSLDALRSGTVKPTQEQMGHRVDLPDAMRSKMEDAFGADLSAVKVYESQTVEDVGANAITQGSNIAFAPGMLDFSSYGGQALLGHEISHVVSQARGEVTGSGFLNDHALEARADREGAMAAAGQQVAVPTGAMTPVTAAAASGPMQAGKKERRAANEKLDKLYRARAYSILQGDKKFRSQNNGMDQAEEESPNPLQGDLTPFNVAPPNTKGTLKTIHSLTDKELDMLRQRIIDSSLKTYKYNEELKKDRNMGQGERLTRTFMSTSSMDAGIYKDILDSFEAGPRFEYYDDKDPTSPKNRSEASRKRVEDKMSARDKRKLDALEGEYDTNAEQVVSDYNDTDAGKALSLDLIGTRIRYLRDKIARRR